MVITAGSPSEAWKILLSLVGESSEAAQDRVKREFEELSFEIGKESMRDYIARAKGLVMKLDQNNVSTTKKEINRRILNGLPSEFDVEKNMFLLMTDTDPDELGEALTRVDDSRTKNGGAGGAHALATGAKPRGGGQVRGFGARRDHGGRGNARGRRDGKGQHHHHQQQWPSQPLVVQQQQQWASQPSAQQQRWASQPPAQQQQPQMHQRQPPQRQLHQQQRPPGHSGGWGPSRVCFRWGQPGHFYAECRAVPPVPYITPQDGQHANYSSTSPGDYASSSGEHRHLMPTPQAPQATPASSDSSCSFSTERAVMTQFCPQGESVDLSGFVSNSSARMVPNSAFASQSHNSRSDFWIGDSGASCHMTNDASKMYCMRPPHFDQKEVITSDGTRLKVKCVGNIDVIFHGGSDEPITMIDVSYVPDLKFNLFSFHKAQQTHVIILDAAGAHIRGKNLAFPCEKGGSYLRATRLVAGTVGAKPRTNRALASQISTPL